jgi:DNA-binding transcriptional LysR family regulator
MDLEELRAFLAVVETGSLLGAERKLNLPRATVRRRIDALEARAGVALFNRARDGVHPTEAGMVLATRGRLMIQEAAALVASIREIGHEPSGVLRVLVPVGLPPSMIVPLFAAVRGAYPRLHVHIRFSADPVGGLLDDVDIAAHFGARSPPGPWTSYELLRVKQQLIAHTDYLSRRGTPTTLDELTKHELLCWEAPGEDPRVWPLRSGGTLLVEPACIASDIHMIRQIVLAGQGIGFVPDALLPDPGTDPEAVVPVLPQHVGRDLPFRLVVPTVLSDLPKIKAVLRHVRMITDAI